MVINYDIKDKRTIQSKFTVSLIDQSHNQQLCSLYTSIRWTLSMAIGQRMTKIHYMSYDVSFV